MMIKMVWHVPMQMLTAMGLANFIRPRTRNWGPARAAIQEYVDEKNHEHRRALNLTELTEIAASELDRPEPPAR